MIKGFQATFVPAFSADGLVLDFPPQQWSVVADENRGVMIFTCNGQSIVKQLRDVWVIQVQNAEDVTDVKRTLGRMALTGIGAHLFTNRSGIGAGLLDLSFRGAVQKGMLSGIIGFRDLTYVNFQVESSRLDVLAPYFPADCATEERGQEALELENLCFRMKADGFPVLEELAGEIGQLSRSVALTNNEVNEGRSFAERDVARLRLNEENFKLERMTNLFFVLLHANKMPLAAFIERTKEKHPQFAELSLPNRFKLGVLILETAGDDKSGEKNTVAPLVQTKEPFFAVVLRDYKYLISHGTPPNPISFESGLVSIIIVVVILLICLQL